MNAPRYRLVLPPGFELFPVRDKSDEQIAEMVRGYYRSLPRDSYGPLIQRVAEQILSVARPAREASVIDLIVPMGVTWRAPISVGIALSLVKPPAAHAEAAWAALAGDRVDTQAGQAVRTAEPGRRTPDPHEIVRLLTVQYVWQIPGDKEHLLMGVYTISAATDPALQPLADALEELGDLILETMRWDAAPAHAEGTTS